MASRLVGAALAAGIVDGSEIMAVALYEPGARYELTPVVTRAERSGERWSLRGNKRVVPQLEAASRILVSARTEEGPALFVVPRTAPGISITGYPLIDGGRRRSDRALHEEGPA